MLTRPWPSGKGAVCIAEGRRLESRGLFCAGCPAGRGVRIADGPGQPDGRAAELRSPGRVRTALDRRAPVPSPDARRCGGPPPGTPVRGSPECARPHMRRLGPQASGVRVTGVRAPAWAEARSSSVRSWGSRARPSAAGADLRGTHGRGAEVRRPRVRGVRTPGTRKAAGPEDSARGHPHSTRPALRLSGLPPSVLRPPARADRGPGPGVRTHAHPSREASCPEPRVRTPAWHCGQGRPERTPAPSSPPRPHCGGPRSGARHVPRNETKNPTIPLEGAKKRIPWIPPLALRPPAPPFGFSIL
jgi:hypothetical protein